MRADILLTLTSVALVAADTVRERGQRSNASRLEKRANAKLVTTCKQPGTFALTFDDGIYDYNAQLLQILKENDAKATFFVNGQNWRCLYDKAEQLQQAYLAGHTIAPHTWAHTDITTMTAKELEADLVRMEVALKKILGVKPALFRPPYGSFNQAQLNVLAAKKYTSIGWSFDSGDTTGSSGSQSKAAYKKLANSYPKPQIALNHETKEPTIAFISDAIKALKVKGYKLVTVDQCLGVKAYNKIWIPARAAKMPKRDSSWAC